MGSHAMPSRRSDVQMGKRHLKMTMDLEKRKIADHKKAAKAAKKAGDTESVRYNLAHMKGHIKDVKSRQKTLKKYAKAKVKIAKKAGK